MMEPVVTGGHRHRSADPRHQRRRKDRHRRDRARNIHTTWFIGLRARDAPRVAIAVVVENQLNGFGGTISAPIAKQVMEALLP